MRQGNSTGVADKAFDASTAADRNIPQASDRSFRVTSPVTLNAAAQALVVVAAPNRLTTLGPEINTDGYTRISLWLDLDINDMTGIRIACYALHTSGSPNAYSPPILNPSVGATPYTVIADGEEIVLARNVDQKIILTWELANTIPIVVFGIAATANAGAAGNVNVSYYTMAWGL